MEMSVSYRRKWDPMNGHLDHPWFYFILWILMGMFCIAFCIITMIAMNTEIDIKDIEIQNLRFSSYKIDDEDLYLYADGDEKLFIIRYYESYENILPKPEELCNGNTYLVGNDGGKYVKYLSKENGQVYITPELERKVYRDTQRMASWVVYIFSPLAVVFCCFGILVGRNPERYSPAFRRMFYRDWTLY